MAGALTMYVTIVPNQGSDSLLRVPQTKILILLHPLEAPDHLERERVIPLVVVVVQLIAMIEKDVTEKVGILQDQMVILVMEVLQMESALAHQGFPRKRKIIMVHKTGRRTITCETIQTTWKKETLRTSRPCRRKKIDIIPKVMG
jgi:hypothetical protein